MIRFFNNFKKYMVIIPIYFLYITIFELILGGSPGDIWDDLLAKFGITTSNNHQTYKLM